MENTQIPTDEEIENIKEFLKDFDIYYYDQNLSTNDTTAELLKKYKITKISNA